MFSGATTEFDMQLLVSGAEVIAEHHLTEATALVQPFEFTCTDVKIASEDT